MPEPDYGHVGLGVWLVICDLRLEIFFFTTYSQIANRMPEPQQLPLKFNNLFLIGYNHRVHREHREVVRKMRDLVRFLRKYTLIFLSVLSVFSVVKSQRELLPELDYD